MASTDTEYYIRLHLLHVEGGTPVLREIMLEHVKKLSPNGNLKQLLTGFHDQIQQLCSKRIINEANYLLLFPKRYDTDIEQWDVSLLCCIILNFCTLEGRLPALKELLHTEVKKCHNSLSNFLSRNKDKIDKLKDVSHEITDEQYELLYPSDGDETDMNLWDIELIICIVLNVCHGQTRQKVTETLHAFIIKEMVISDSANNLNKFLNDKRALLEDLRENGTLTNDQFQHLYPSGNEIADLYKWSDELLKIIVVKVCPHLSNKVIEAVKTIRDVRNAMVHKCKAQQSDFLKEWTTLHRAITALLLHVPRIKRKMQEKVGQLESGPLEIKPAIDILKEWYMKDMSEHGNILDMLNTIESKLTSVETNIKSHMDYIESKRRDDYEEMMKAINCYFAQNPDSAYPESVKISCVDFVIVIKGTNKDAVQKAEQMVYDAIEKNNDDDTKKIQAVINVIVNSILKDGTTIVEIRHGSVVLRVKCISIRGLYTLFKTIDSDEFLEQMRELSALLSETLGDTVSLTASISSASLRQVHEDINNIISSKGYEQYMYQKTVSVRLKPSTYGGLKNILQMVEGGGIKTELKTLSEGVSEHLKERIIISARIEGLQEALQVSGASKEGETCKDSKQVEHEGDLDSDTDIRSNKRILSGTDLPIHNRSNQQTNKHRSDVFRSEEKQRSSSLARQSFRRVQEHRSRSDPGIGATKEEGETWVYSEHEDRPDFDTVVLGDMFKSEDKQISSSLARQSLRRVQVHRSRSDPGIAAKEEETVKTSIRKTEMEPVEQKVYSESDTGATIEERETCEDSDQDEREGNPDSDTGSSYDSAVEYMDQPQEHRSLTDSGTGATKESETCEEEQVEREGNPYSDTGSSYDSAVEDIDQLQEQCSHTDLCIVSKTEETDEIAVSQKVYLEIVSKIKSDDIIPPPIKRESQKVYLDTGVTKKEGETCEDSEKVERYSDTKCNVVQPLSLILAAQNGHIDVVTHLLEHNADVNQCRNDHASPLYIAAENGHIDVVTLLLEHKADVNLCRNNGASPLFITAQNGHIDVVTLLLKHKANVNTCRNDGASPLYIAAENGHIDVVTLLLEHKADVNLFWIYRTSPLYIAAQNGHIDVVTLLLEHKVDVNLCRNDGASPLYIAVQNGHIDVVTLLLEHKANVNTCMNDGASPFYIAMKKGHIGVIALLLKHKADVNLCRNDDAPPLYIASQNGHIDDVTLLLEHKANVNLCWNDDVPPLYIASQNGHIDVVTLLLEHKANVNLCWNDDVPPLYIAAENGHIDVVTLLLEHKADVNLCRNDGASPLYSAAQNGHIDVVTLLLEHKADVNLCRNEGISPLLIAAGNGHIDVVTLLLEHKADVNLCTKYGGSPLFFAAQNGHVDIFNIFLQFEANINQCLDYGVSPLFIAATQGHTDIVRILLKRKADLKTHWKETRLSKNFVTHETRGLYEIQLQLNDDSVFDKVALSKHGVSPLYIAAQNGHTQIVCMLLEYKTDVDINQCWEETGQSPLFAASGLGRTEVVQILLEYGADTNICSRKIGESALTVAARNGHNDIVRLLKST